MLERELVRMRRVLCLLGCLLVGVLVMAACASLSPAPTYPTGETGTPASLPGPAVAPGATLAPALGPQGSATEPKLPGASIRFDHITPEDGLPGGAVYWVTQDRLGFLWIGTNDGLARYDGRAFKVYRHDPDDAASLSENHVFHILEDRQGSLWVATYGGGLERLDREQETFKHYDYDPNDPFSLGNNKVFGLFEDSAGVLWIATSGGGLDRYDPDVDGFVHYRHDPDDPDSLISDYVNVIYEGRKGNLWLGTTGGLEKFDRKTETFTHYRHDPSEPYSLSNDQVFSITEARWDMLWVGTSGGGLNLFVEETGQFFHYRHDPEDPYSLSDDVVFMLLKDSTGTLWTASLGGGLHRFDPEGERFIRYRHDPANPHSLGGDSVNTLFEDREGTIWIGTTQGLDRYARQRNKFDRFLSLEFVEAVMEDRQGRVWLGMTDGLYRLDARLKQKVVYQNEPDDPDSLSAGWVQALYESADGVLWIGTSGGGLDRFDQATERFVHYRHLPGDAQSLSNDTVNVIYEDSRGALWIGTDGGLNRFDRETGSFALVPTVPEEPGAAQVESVSEILEDRDGALWVGTWGDGLKRFEPDSDRVTQYRHESHEPGSLRTNFVSALWLDAGGRLWVGTDGGLHRFDPDANQFEYYGEEHGLREVAVGAITEDAEGALWIAMGSSVAKLDPERDVATRYDVEYGVHGGSYAADACVRDDGEMLFGGADGVVIFDPAEIHPNPYAPPVAFVSLRQGGTEVALDAPLESANSVEFAWPEQDFEFEFAALSYVQPELNQHAYKLEGYDEAWNYIGTNRTGRYTNLPGGTYKLLIRGANSDGVWNNVAAALEVVIVPPVWDTLWFRGLAVVLLGGAVLAGYRLRVRSIEGRTRELERQVASRTRELSALNTIATVVSGSLDLEHVLDGALERTLEVTGLEAGGIYLLKRSAAAPPGEGGSLRLAAHKGIDPSLLEAIDNLAVGEGFSGRVVQSGEPVIVRDLGQDERLTRKAVSEQGYRSLAAVPLVSRGKVLGSLFVMTTSRGRFSPQNVELLHSIGGQIGVAVENARLYEDTERRLAQISALQETAMALTSTLELDELLHLITEQAAELARADGGVLNLVDWEKGEDEAVACTGSMVPGLGYRSRLTDGLSGWIAMHDEPAISAQIHDDVRVNQGGLSTLERALDRRMGSAAGVPLHIKGQVVGSLVVVERAGGERNFAQSDLDLLVAFANQAAAAIENARLFQAEQHRAEQFRVISEVGRRVTSLLEIDEVLAQVVRLIQEAFEYDHVGIALIEDDDAVYKVGAGELWNESSAEGQVFEFRPARLKVGEAGVTGWVAGTGEPLLVPDVAQEPRYVPMEGSRTRSELTVPIKAKGQVIGVLDVQSNRLNAFGTSDVVLLQALADQAAIAVENARLYEQAQRLAAVEERGRLARELHDAVTQTLFSASLIAEALPELWDSDPEEGRSLLGELRQLSRGALAEMRTLLLELRPTTLVEANLRDLLRQLGEAAAGRTGSPVEVWVVDADRLPDEVHVALYRIAQEALNNVVKHSRASRVSVSLRCLDDGDGDAQTEAVRLQIEDDGRGFDLGQVPPDRLGLGIIRERAQAIGAALEIESQPGQGSRITVVWREGA